MEQELFVWLFEDVKLYFEIKKAGDKWFEELYMDCSLEGEEKVDHGRQKSLDLGNYEGLPFYFVFIIKVSKNYFFFRHLFLAQSTIVNLCIIKRCIIQVNSYSEISSHLLM